MSLLEIISIITAFQLLQLGVVLHMIRSGNQASNRILGLYMFFNAMLIIGFAFGFDLFKHVKPDTFFYFLLAPYLFLYVKSLTRQQFTRNYQELFHWIPAVVYLILDLIISLNEELVYGILQVQIASYLLWSFLLLARYQKWIRSQFSSIQRIDLAWMIYLLGAFCIMWGTDLVAFILTEFDLLTNTGIHYFSLTSISINLVFATTLVILGLRHQKVLSGMKDPPKYSGSNLSEQKQHELGVNLTTLMEQGKPYLEPELNIKELAQQLSVHPKALSQVINAAFQVNFFDFVNAYRIKEAKNILSEYPDKTILEVLYAVGYNSKSAFNKAFKKETGLTPSEYKKEQKKGPLS